MEKMTFTFYEFSMTFAGALTAEERDEIDEIRYKLHEKCYRYTRKNMNALEEVTRMTTKAIKKLQETQNEKEK